MWADVNMFLRLLCTIGLLLNGIVAKRNRLSCYNVRGQAQRCFPPIVNAAFNLPVVATNTCGMNGPEEFCQKTEISSTTKSCDVCDNNNPQKAHPPSYLTDSHNVENLSWWQSSTMLQNVQWPNSVNLTLNFGKSFDIAYIQVKFHPSRPESFAIYKRTNENSPWIPFQFYSASCRETYNMNPSDAGDMISRENQAAAVCHDDSSDISPLSGSSVAFGTLVGRPSATEFDSSPLLQEWITATDIKIVLNRINTFGDEVFGDVNVLQSYFYAISDFVVVGRCKCNGHASECYRTTTQNGEERLVCRCEHNTDGPDCERCLPFYNDQPWRRAPATSVVECQACNCNGLSDRCYFDKELFRRTGHGGHCTGCRENREGVNCERCKENYYRRNPNDRCLPCSCSHLANECNALLCLCA